MSDDLVKRLEMKASMIELGERIEWGSDSAIMREAKGCIEALRTENARLRKILKSMDDTIVARSELFISDQECLFNLRDRIRRALETKKGPGD